MLYLTLKHLHVVCVVLSIGGFCLRGWLLLRKSALAGRHPAWHDGRPWLCALPHINDCLLLAAFGWIVSVVLSKHPAGFLAVLV